MSIAWDNLKIAIKTAKEDLLFIQKSGDGAKVLNNVIETLSLILRSSPPGPSARRTTIVTLWDSLYELDACGAYMQTASIQDYVDSVSRRLSVALHDYSG